MATADPTGGIGQAAGELLKDMQKAQAEMQQAEQKGHSGVPSAGFQQAMQAQAAQQAGQASQMAASQASQQAAVQTQSGRVQTDNAIGKVIKDAQVRDKLASSPTTQVGATEKSEEGKLSKMLQNLITGQDKMTNIMHMALSGRQFSPSELLAMQAGVYRFTQELDLTSKVVEKATGGVKQTLNTQV